MAQRVGTIIALLFHDCSTRRGLVVSSMPQPHFTPRKDPVPILQEAEWTPGPVRMGGKSRLHWDLIPDRPAHSHRHYTDWATRPTKYIYKKYKIYRKVEISNLKYSRKSPSFCFLVAGAWWWLIVVGWNLLTSCSQIQCCDDWPQHSFVFNKAMGMSHLE